MSSFRVSPVFDELEAIPPSRCCVNKKVENLNQMLMDNNLIKRQKMQPLITTNESGSIHLQFSSQGQQAIGR